MLVRDVMTVRVRTVSPDTPLKEVASLLIGERISGVPVVQDGRVVGILSEADLVPLRESRPGRPLRTAANLMTRPVITVTEDITVTEAARVLERHRIKRAPVLREGRLVGMVTRSDLLRPYLRTDGEIRAEVEDAVLREAMGLSPREVQVSVAGGVVTIEGRVAAERDRALLLRLARGVDGVVDVADRLAVATAV